MVKSRAIEAALVIGGAVGIATTVVNPVYTGASLAFMGGILGGASLSAQRAMKNESTEREAERGWFDLCNSVRQEQRFGRPC